jgi:hypothetical protein
LSKLKKQQKVGGSVLMLMKAMILGTHGRKTGRKYLKMEELSNAAMRLMKSFSKERL